MTEDGRTVVVLSQASHLSNKNPFENLNYSDRYGCRGHVVKLNKSQKVFDAFI